MKYLVIIAIFIFIPETYGVEQYFSPRPDEPLILVEQDLISKRNNPMQIRGIIQVTPPKHRCLIIQLDPKKSDLRICRKRDIYWKLKDLDFSGNLKWIVHLQGENERSYLSWSSKFRIAQTIQLGMLGKMQAEPIPVIDCKVKDNSIELSLANSKKWTIWFPKEDVKAVTSVENLATKGSIEDYKNAVESAKNDKDSYRFSFSVQGSFEMESGNFRAQAAPRGMNGKCRYRYQNAPEDPKSGVIECLDTDAFDAVYTHLTCASKLGR